MLYLTKSDKSSIEINYWQFLANLKIYLEKINVHDFLTTYSVINELLHSGKFSLNNTITFSVAFPYLDFPNLEYSGAQVMQGTCCCRHVNLLVNDILSSLGFSTYLQYFKTRGDTWIRTDALNANHIAIILHDNNNDYLVDSFNNFVCQIAPNLDLTQISLPTITQLITETPYQDTTISQIGHTFQKYYNCQSLGINYVYDYDY